jgi:uncharacterized protein (TIGR00369 family)
MKLVDNNKCFACGVANPHGLKLEFEQDGEDYFCEFYTEERYQGYTGVLHGGIAATILDEVMFKHLNTRDMNVVTASMELRYRKPVPTGVTVRCVARQMSERRNIYVMSAVVILPNGDVAVEATGKFVRLKDGVQDVKEERQ